MLQMEVENVEHVDAVQSGMDPSELGTSVGKAMALLTAFDRAGPIGVSELARRTNLPKSTAFRLLAVLERWQLVERVDNRYRLGSRLFELGNRVVYCSPRGLREIAHPFLEELHEITHETVHLAVLVDHDVLYLDKVYGHNQVRCPSRVGGRFPAHCSALGKAILAYGDACLVREVLASHLERRTPYTIVHAQVLCQELQSIRQMGIAFDRDGGSIGLTCVAAPIRNRLNETVAAVSISGATGRFDPTLYVERIRRTARAIGSHLCA
jgi:IclR family transcriptional regulator, KDG regulon repressor